VLFRSVDSGMILGEIPVKRGSVQRVQVAAATEAYATLPVEASSSLLTTKVQLEENVRAPVAKGQKVGVVEVFADGLLIGTVDAVTTDGIPEGGVLSIVGISDETAKVIERTFASILIAIVLLFAAYVALKRRQIKRRKQRRLERAMGYRQMEERQRFDDFRRY
jgi:D-alanyl-D-alanine carboxypeptidase (penicillin-binding protein 5/6)